jgi:hypothetical protein
MKRWRVQVTIIEHGRVAEVEAETAAVARALARRGDWDTEIGLTEATSYTVTVSGEAVLVADASPKEPQ